MIKKHLLKPIEVATFLGVTRQTVYNWIWEGKIPAYKIGNIIRIPRDSVLELFQERKEKRDI
ncbi:MAG: helix-turn-helix domain-containing protein [candidate division WOR-3 bacterium]